MQNSLLNFYYICWMELSCMKPNPLSLGGRLFINIIFFGGGRLIERGVYLKGAFIRTNVVFIYDIIVTN